MKLLSRHPALAILSLLVVVWVVELFWVQELYLFAPFKRPEMFRTRQAFRLGLDVALVCALVFTVPRKGLYALFVAGFFAYSAVGVYHDYYGRLPRLSLLVTQTGEGAAILPLILGMLPFGRTSLLLASLALKCGLLWRASRYDGTPSWVVRKRAIAGSSALYVALFVIANLTFDPMTNMKKWGTTSRFGMTYGFFVPLAFEAYLSGSDTLLDSALESARQSTDRLTPVETPIAIHDRIVLLQVESLDWGVMGHTHRGQEVVPLLNDFMDASMLYKAEAAHFTGSADADFVALMAVWPSREIVTYKIEGYPFDGALPHRLRRWGYASTAIHGVSGTFFDRRSGFSQMGFDRLIFKEELKELGIRIRHDRYDWVQDGELMDFAARKLESSAGRVLHMVITVTSHSPFKELPPDERERCPEWDDDVERYFCSMRYVDRAVGDYLRRLPEGTTAIVYGDHNSSIETEGYDSGRRGERDWVPVMIHNRPGDLRRAQRTRDDLAVSGELSFVDVMRYVFRQIERKHETVAKPTVASE